MLRCPSYTVATAILARRHQARGHEPGIRAEHEQAVHQPTLAVRGVHFQPSLRFQTPVMVFTPNRAASEPATTPCAPRVPP